MSSTASLDGSYEDSLVNEKSDLVSTQQYKDQSLQWIDKYASDMVENSNYTEPKHVVKAFVELGLDRQSRILDILAGSGVVAELLRPCGYTNIDAVDASKDMLALSNKKQLYKKFYVSLLGGQHKAPVQDETYDAIIASGTFAPGHLNSDAFGDLIRIAKPGAIITWSMRSDYGPSSPKFVNFDAEVEDLVKNGVWRHHVPRRTIESYLLGSDGYIYTMKKI
uniref:Methyltransferase domain-containing protein n=1 Tax=Daphnia galeata TaxID=27404 RepID=A0A8J2RNJ3_9CRUS|nr:unnamed protein product [Daphnia galeata]